MELLRIEGLEKSFDGEKILHEINFSLEKGEVLSIIGSSGSGKTTLLRCLNFLTNPEAGKILLFEESGEVKTLFDAEDQQDKKNEDYETRLKRLNFGLVFQSFNLFPQYTILKNVTLAKTLLDFNKSNTYKWYQVKKKKELKNQIEKNNEVAAKKILGKVGLIEKINSYPHEISGGQAQRVAIARALALEPKILCFDEPTSALDPELTGEVLKVIKELRDDKKTMIIVTHEMDFAKKVSDKILYLDKGRVAAYGTPKEIFEDKSNKRLQEFINQHEKW